MYRRLGRTAEARSSYEKALALARQETALKVEGLGQSRGWGNRSKEHQSDSRTNFRYARNESVESLL